MNELRKWMLLCEGKQIANSIIDQAVRNLINNIDWIGGEGEIVTSTIIAKMGYNNDISGYDPDEPEKFTETPEFKSALERWARDEITGAYDEIEYRFKGEVIRVYRMIMASRDWKPDPTRHPGIYWSWDERHADAHQGDFGKGNIKWMMMADVHRDQINWPQTLAANGSPDLHDEREITLLENMPVKILGYWPVGRKHAAIIMDEKAPTIVSASTSKIGINRATADRILDPHGYFKKKGRTKKSGGYP